MVEREPLLGEGAGSFERWWLRGAPGRELRARRAQPVSRDARGARAGRPRAPRCRARAHRWRRCDERCGIPLAAGAARRVRGVPRPRRTRLGLGGAARDAARTRLRGRARRPRHGPGSASAAGAGAPRAAGIAAAAALVGVALVAHVGNRAAAASEDALARAEPGSRCSRRPARAHLAALGGGSAAAARRGRARRGHDPAAAGHLRALAPARPRELARAGTTSPSSPPAGGGPQRSTGRGVEPARPRVASSKQIPNNSGASFEELPHLVGNGTSTGQRR